MIPTQDLQTYITLLKNGNLLIYPTDTLYALGADIYNSEALNRLYELKLRPKEKQFPIGISNLNQLKEIAELNEIAETLASYFLPGPLTLILKTKESAPAHLKQHPTIAIRIPDQPIAQTLYKTYGPLTLTSANIHGKNAYKVPEIQTQLKTQLPAIDIGTLKGRPSTIVDTTQNSITILREGPITQQMIKEKLRQ